MKNNQIIQGHALEELKKLPNESVNCVMTSPPYWSLRDYSEEVEIVWGGAMDCEHNFDIKERKLHGGSAENTVHGAILAGGLEVDWKTKDGFCKKCGAWKGQLGLEPTFDLYIKHLCDIFDEVKRVLRKDGCCFVNLGDTYSSSPSGFSKEKAEEWGKKGDGIIKRLYQRHTRGMTTKPTPKPKINYPSKCLTMIPERFAIEMINRKWILRNKIIWHKRNCMPDSTKDRFTVDFEYLFFFSKSKKYYFETQREPIQSKPTLEVMPPIGGKKQTEGNFNPTYSGNQPKWRGLKSGNPNIGQQQYHSSNIKTSELGRNKRCVWTINPKPFSDYICSGCGYYGKVKSIKETKGYFGGEDKDKRPCPKCRKRINISHFAIYPEELCEIPIKAGCPKGGIVLDPFFGAGTTGLVALKQNKKIIGIELNNEYIGIAKERLKPYLEQKKL